MGHLPYAAIYKKARRCLTRGLFDFHIVFHQNPMNLIHKICNLCCLLDDFKSRNEIR